MQKKTYKLNFQLVPDGCWGANLRPAQRGVGQAAPRRLCARGRQMLDLRAAGAAGSARSVGVRRRKARSEPARHHRRVPRLSCGDTHRQDVDAGQRAGGAGAFYEGERLHAERIPRGAGRGHPRARGTLASRMADQDRQTERSALKTAARSDGAAPRGRKRIALAADGFLYASGKSGAGGFPHKILISQRRRGINFGRAGNTGNI